MSLPEGWRETTLGNVFVISSGKSRPKTKGNYPVYGGNGILDYTDKYNQEKKIIIGRVGVYCGNIFFEESKFWLSDNALGVSNNDSSNIKFLYYKLIDMKLNNYAIGGAQPLLTQTLLKDLEIIIPPLQEQKIIANILSSFDKKIELLNEQNETLELMAQGVFKEWFLDGVEESWKLATIGDIAILKSGKSRPKDDTGINNIPIYGGNGILGYTSKYNADGESIIIGRVGEYCGSLYLENKEIWVSDNALLAKPLEDIYLKYLLYILKVNRLNSKSEGSSQPLLTQTIIKSIPINLPPIALLQEFNLQAIAWYNKINLNTEQIKTLQKIRDTLLPRLMSGEKRVML